ncbi:sigma-70 family RNA polymerase sigma factor [Streptomyces litchfieldiae]|uniref:RNA polymerase sigma factor n=1 Tax=Streptomyces litchfieldiae TaxID=3075543 RepID=A0ABU2MWJ1_9ACTN|nr:sigma-70 family RNA polymerase sigma factor [Streptomyces sp. DSM 44938]MDT0346016.1 sigma-70 family RNA polymerase sigma factor [Streptomyces sp. DSM 44938]
MNPTPSRRQARRRDDDAAVTDWALAARTGNQHAAERFIRATRSDVRRYVVHLTGDPQGAEDLTQETFLRALRSLPRFEGRATARTWLLAIARRTVVDRIRHDRARPALISTDSWETVAETAQRRENRPGFEDGVALAGRLVGTVRSRVNRARRALATQLES